MPVNIPLNADALTSIEVVELLLDRVGQQGTADDETNDRSFIAFLINAFSDAAHTYSGRQWKPTEAGATKVFVYDGNGRLSLAPFEASVVTSVVAYTDRPVADQLTLTAQDEYLLEPRQKTPQNTYLALTLPASLREGAQVSVTGNWGAGSVPSDVEYAVAAEAANAYMRATQRAPRGIAAEDYFGPDIGPLALSRRAQAILDLHANRSYFG
jgi:hypothetical protein